MAADVKPNDQLDLNWHLNLNLRRKTFLRESIAERLAYYVLIFNSENKKMPNLNNLL